jgi:putative transposase
MKKSKFSNSQVLSILNQDSAGLSVPDICREHGISSRLISSTFNVN